MREKMLTKEKHDALVALRKAERAAREVEERKKAPSPVGCMNTLPLDAQIVRVVGHCGYCGGSAVEYQVSELVSKSKPRPPPPVGSEVKFRVCAECGGSIGSGGLCSFNCPRDADGAERPTRFYVYKFDRVEEQVSDS